MVPLGLEQRQLPPVHPKVGKKELLPKQTEVLWSPLNTSIELLYQQDNYRTWGGVMLVSKRMLSQQGNNELDLKDVQKTRICTTIDLMILGKSKQQENGLLKIDISS